MEASELNNTFTTGGEYELRCAIKIYGQPILRYCHNILCDYFEAQDAVQMTFIKALTKEKALKAKHHYRHGYIALHIPLVLIY